MSENKSLVFMYGVTVPKSNFKQYEQIVFITSLAVFEIPIEPKNPLLINRCDTYKIRDKNEEFIFIGVYFKAFKSDNSTYEFYIGNNSERLNECNYVDKCLADYGLKGSMFVSML